MGKKRKFPTAILAVLTILLAALPVHAAGQGRLTVTLETEEAEAAFAMYRVAEIKNGVFVLTEAFEKTGVDPNSLDNVPEVTAYIENLTKYVEANKPDILMEGDTENGSIVFEGLDMGLYFVIQVPRIEDKLAVMPLLIAVPLWNEKTGNYEYDVRANPKDETLKPPSETPSGEENVPPVEVPPGGNPEEPSDLPKKVLGVIREKAGEAVQTLTGVLGERISTGDDTDAVILIVMIAAAGGVISYFLAKKRKET